MLSLSLKCFLSLKIIALFLSRINLVNTSTNNYQTAYIKKVINSARINATQINYFNVGH